MKIEHIFGKAFYPRVTVGPHPDSRTLQLITAKEEVSSLRLRQKFFVYRRFSRIFNTVEDMGVHTHTIY